MFLNIYIQGRFIAFHYGVQDIPEWILVVAFSLLIILCAGLFLFSGNLYRRTRLLADAQKTTETQLRMLTQNLPETATFSIRHDKKRDDFQFLSISENFNSILKMDRKLFLNDARMGIDCVFEDDLPLLREAFTPSGTVAPADLEIRILDATGTCRWLHISAQPVTENQELVWHGIIQDASALKEAETALAGERSNFKQLTEQMNEFLIVCNMDGQLLYTNPAAGRRLGYSARELEDMSIFELYKTQDQQHIYEVVAKLRTQKNASCNLPILLADGTDLPVEMELFCGLKDQRNAFFAVARDVSIRKEGEAAFRESQKMLQLIIDNIPLSIFWKDKDSVYLGCNRAFIKECRLQNPDDIIGKTPFDLFDSVQASEVVEHDQSVIKTNKALVDYSESHTRPDGSLGWREISLNPLRDEAGKAVGVLGAWRDVTEQNQAEERLKRTLDDMERFNQLMRGRERRTLELKAEINNLLMELGKPKKYRTTTNELY